MNEIDMVKGYHGTIDQIPKEYREIVRKRFEHLEIEGVLEDYMLDVDIYISVDVRNAYEKDLTK
jgi:hypothetical protein